MMDFRERFLNTDKNTYFIAEIGINHNGVFELAHEMIKKSKESGASAVKFQKRNTDHLLLPGLEIETPTGYLSKNADDLPDESKAFGTWTYPDKRLEFSDEQHLDLWRYAESLGLDYIVSPWDENSLDFLVQNEAKVIKIASIDCNNFHFMRLVASKRVPVIASVGMCNWSEISQTWQIFEEANCPLMFLHCTSAYPCEIKDKNLKCIPVLRQLFNQEVGFSGHGVGFTGAFGAVALGVKVIEKHVTLSRKMSGPDQAASLEFDEVTTLICESNKIIEALGTTNKVFLDSEATLHGVLSKRIVTSKSIKANDQFNFENLKTVVTKQPGGILPNKYFEVINRTSKSDLPKNHILEMNDLV